MSARLGNTLYDPETGDIGRVVCFDVHERPVCQTEGGRLFKGGKHLTGRRTLESRFEAGDLKVCDCAGCRKILLGNCHAEEVREAQAAGENTTLLPELVAARFNERPYCRDCLRRM